MRMILLVKILKRLPSPLTPWHQAGLHNTRIANSTPLSKLCSLHQCLRQCAPMYTNVHFSAPMYTSLHQCLHQYAPMYTHVHFFAPMYTSVRQYTPICIFLHQCTPVCSNVCTNVRQCCCKITPRAGTKILPNLACFALNYIALKSSLTKATKSRWGRSLGPRGECQPAERCSSVWFSPFMPLSMWSENIQPLKVKVTKANVLTLTQKNFNCVWFVLLAFDLCYRNLHFSFLIPN